MTYLTFRHVSAFNRAHNSNVSDAQARPQVMGEEIKGNQEDKINRDKVSRGEFIIFIVVCVCASPSRSTSKRLFERKAPLSTW